MGVKGLLPCLQSITRTVSLERYRGLTVAVDAMSWLHKGVFACDVKALAKSQRGNESEKAASTELKCINYTINKAESLQLKFGIEVLLVIDGDSLPSKKEENAQRGEERDKAFEKAMAAEKARDSRAARRFYAQSCSVTHKIRYELIKACKQLGIAFLVAPYEADAQMARLAHTGTVDLVITEDSDILVYGCPRALFKVDFDTYRGQEIQLMRDLGENVTPSFRNWTHDMFVFMCIISGCDYCKGVPGIGIKLAHKLVRVHRTPSKIFSALRAAGRMPADFEEKFWIAFRTFRHQRVFCPSKQQIETLWPIAGSNLDATPNGVWPFLGENIEPRIASKIADGTLHPSKKVAWNEALKSQHGSESMPAKLDDIHIHHRSSTEGQNRRGANCEKANVWHSLVYGPKDGEKRSREEKHEHQHSAQNILSKREMFSFFPQNKTRGKEDAETSRNKMPPESDGRDSTIRPPLQEIYVGTDSNSQSKSNYAPPAYHKDVPIHFHEYASRLVGKSFKPISRKRKKKESDGTKSSNFVQQIWRNAPKSKGLHEKGGDMHRSSRAEVRGHAQEERVPKEGKEQDKETEGVSLFKKHNATRNTSDGYDSGCISGNSNYFHLTTDQPYRGGTTQHQHDMDPNFSFHQRIDGDNDDPRRYSYQHDASVVQPFDDRSVHPTHYFPSHQRRVGHQNCYLEDGATTCEESSRVESESHLQYYSSNNQHIDEALPQSHIDSRCCLGSSYPAFKDSDIEESRLFAEPQSFSAPDVCYDDTDSSYNCQVSHKEYGIEEGGPNQYRSEFEQLKTTMKKKRDGSSCGGYTDHINCGSYSNPMVGHDCYSSCRNEEIYSGGSAAVGKTNEGVVFEDGLLDTFDAMQNL